MHTYKAFRTLFAAALLILAAAALQAQATDAAQHSTPKNTFEAYPSALGVTLSDFNAVSLSWKRLFNRVGVEIAASGFWDPQNTTGFIYWYSLSSGVSYRLFAEDFANWIAGGLDIVAFAGFRGEDGYEAASPPGGGIDYVRTGYRPFLFLGAGIGIETVLFRHFSQEVQFFYFGRFLSNPGINFGANFSFRYRF